MGVRRYSRNYDVRRWQEQFDEFQRQCQDVYLSPTIGELLDHGATRGQWRCRSVGWKPDGKPECWHSSPIFPLSRYPRHVRVFDIRQRNTCGACGRKRPFLELWPED
jgi:hypothetical protein